MIQWCECSCCAMSGGKAPRALIEAYEDPSAEGSLGGVHRFARAHNLSLSRARRLLEGVLSYTLHRPTRKRFGTLPVLVFGVDEQWVADLMEVQKIARANRGTRYLLAVIDVLSKYAWVEPVKDKTGAAVTRAFERILTRAGGRRPLKLQTDAGKEFYNRTFETLLKRHNIQHFSTFGDAKASVVERFNRTFKGRLYRYFTARGTYGYLDVLQELVQGYNASKHRSIGLAPKDVTPDNEEFVWQRLYGARLRPKRKRPGLVKGDRVRLNKKHALFRKGYVSGWTEEVFVVRRVVPGALPTYRVQEWDGTPVEGTFYEEDLQKVTMPDDALFRVEKILARRGTRIKVRWLGWPAKYDSWIERAQLQRV